MKKFKEIRNFSVLLAALLSILTVAALLVSNVVAKPITVNPGNPWPTGTIWGTNLTLENGSFVGQAWYGVGTSELKVGAPPDPPDGLIVEFFDNNVRYFTWVKAPAANENWPVRLRTVGAAPDGGILRSMMSDVNTLYVPTDYSVVLDNQSGNGIFINLRAGSSQITGLNTDAKYATLYVDNAVNIESIDNLDPLTGAAGDTLRLRVFVKNTGRYTDNYSISAGGSLNPTIFYLAPGSTDNVIMNTTLPNGTKNIVITAAGDYATDQDFITATGDTSSNSHDIRLFAGWNLVSFPVVDNTTTPNHIFAPLTYYDNYVIYSWSAPYGPYAIQDPDTVFNNTRGYWVWIDQDMTIILTTGFGENAQPIFMDKFDTLNQNIWFANFYQQDWHYVDPSYGTAYVADGVLFIRPYYYRGVPTIQTRNQVITTLPATLKFRIMFEGDYYRFPSIALNPVFGEVINDNNPRIEWYLGTTNHIFYPYGQYVGAYRPGNQVESNKVFSVIPVDEWLEGEIRLYNDRVETSFNGVNLVLYTNVESIVNFAGGLNIYFQAGDDYGQKGLDLDWVIVEAGAP